MITTVLFDLDGTLLPMDQEVFLNAYMSGLAAKMAPYGYDPKLLIKSLWKGTAAMRDCPVPAYVVPNPNCCYNANVTFGNGCGCGSF